MPTKKSKRKLPEYGLGGDILNTGLNVLGDLTGTGTITDAIAGSLGIKKPKIENEFLQKINKLSDDVVAPISRTVGSTALNIVAPGLGTVYSGVTQTAQGIADSTNAANVAANQPPAVAPLTVDPRYVRRAKGGPLVQLPNVDMGTDLIPTDAQGVPSIMSKRKPVAMTDAGEVIWNGYVFSKDLGYADQAKKILNQYKLRPEDKFSIAARDRKLTDLMNKQEASKPQSSMKQELPGFHEGGRPGHTHTEEYLRAYNKFYNIDTPELPVSDVLTFDLGVKFPPLSPLKPWRMVADKPTTNIPVNKKSTSVIPSVTPSITPPVTPLTESTLSGIRDPRVMFTNQPLSRPDTLNTRTLAKSSYPQNESVVDPTINTDLNTIDYSSLIGMGAQAIPLIAKGLRLAKNKPERVITPKFTPEQIDLSQQREELERQATGTRNTLMRNSRNNLAAQIAGITSVDEQLNSNLGESWMRQSAQNAMERNRAGMFNTQITQQDNERTAQEQAMYNMMVDQLWGDVGTTGAQMSNDIQQRKMQNKLLKIMQTKDFKIDPNTWAVMLKYFSPSTK